MRTNGFNCGTNPAAQDILPVNCCNCFLDTRGLVSRSSNIARHSANFVGVTLTLAWESWSLVSSSNPLDLLADSSLVPGDFEPKNQPPQQHNVENVCQLLFTASGHNQGIIDKHL